MKEVIHHPVFFFIFIFFLLLGASLKTLLDNSEKIGPKPIHVLSKKYSVRKGFSLG